MSVAQSSSDFRALLRGMPNEEVLRLAKYLNAVQLPLQTRCQNVQQSRLLQLPQELRDNIIRMNVPETIMVDPWNVLPPTPPPTWLHVCSQLRLDAAQVYFSTPIFLPFVSDEVFTKWAESIDVECRQFIKSVHIDRFIPDLEQAVETARRQDKIGGFRAGTVWAPSSTGESGNTTSVWVNAKEEMKLYEEVLPIEDSLSSALSAEKPGCWE